MKAYRTKKEIELASLASQKFELLNIASADEELPPGAVLVLLHYIQFVRDFDLATPYASTIDLQVATGQVASTIADHRAQLEKLGYMTRAGKTSAGVIEYSFSFCRREIVMTRQAEKEKKLKAADAIRKKLQQGKRRRDAVISKFRVTPNPIPEGCDYDFRGDVTPNSGDNNLDDNLERSGTDSKPHNQGQPSPSSYRHSYQQEDNPDLPFPPVHGESDAIEFALRILQTENDLTQATLGLEFKKMLLAGKLTPAIAAKRMKEFAT